MSVAANDLLEECKTCIYRDGCDVERDERSYCLVRYCIQRGAEPNLKENMSNRKDEKQTNLERFKELVNTGTPKEIAHFLFDATSSYCSEMQCRFQEIPCRDCFINWLKGKDND